MGNSFSYVAPVATRNMVPKLASKSAQLSEPESGDSVSSVDTGADEARAARVAELKAQYQAGKYSVELREVSSKMIEKHLDH